MDRVRLEEFNQKLFEETEIDKAILAFGSCESHGGHIPYGIDAFVSHHLAEEVAKRLEKTVVVPPLWYGMSLHYRHKPMCISLTNETITRVIREVLESLAYWGIMKALIINGHDGNIPCIEAAARDVKLKHPDMGIAILDAWWNSIGDLLPKGTFEVWNGLGHGGEGEASISLAVVPHLCDMSQAKGQIPKMDKVVKLVWNFQELTDYGASGAPEKATREKGEMMKKALVDYLVKFVKQMDEQGWRFQKR